MKKLILCGVAAFAAFAVTGCRMCVDPILNDPTCIEPSHYRATDVNPLNINFKKPLIAESLELFRPVFKAGNRITVVGEGTSVETATFDAFAKFMAKANCDYIVAVTRVINKKTHPTWRIFATTNYTVTLSGIPVILEKLSCETIKEKEVEERKEKEDKCDKKEEKIIVNVDCKCPAPAAAQATPALLKLSDIDVKINAKGSTDDKAGIIFPVKQAVAK